jgi:hypothetical protein
MTAFLAEMTTFLKPLIAGHVGQAIVPAAGFQPAQLSSAPSEPQP